MNFDASHELRGPDRLQCDIIGETVAHGRRDLLHREVTAHEHEEGVPIERAKLAEHLEPAVVSEPEVDDREVEWLAARDVDGFVAPRCLEHAPAAKLARPGVEVRSKIVDEQHTLDGSRLVGPHTRHLAKMLGRCSVLRRDAAETTVSPAGHLAAQSNDRAGHRHNLLQGLLLRSTTALA